MHPAITAALGFLAAVLWFDLMFDVQVLPHRGRPELPDDTLDSIATYYRRVTTEASPMGRLVAVVMLVLLGLLVWQATSGDVPGWLTIASLLGAGGAIGLAAARVVPSAVRLGIAPATDPDRSRLARGIFRDHVVCLGLIVAVLVAQLLAGG